MTDAPDDTSHRTQRALIALRLIGVLLLVAVVAAAAVATGLWSLNDDPDEPEVEWDPKVAGLAAFVEDERDLEFDHPVAIDFLSEREFEKEVTSEEEDLSDEEKEEIEQTGGLLRALGLLDHRADLLEVVNDLTGGAVIGLYDDEDKRIRMRGEDLTPATRATLVHELTHALQDQHFDLEGRSEEFDDADDDAVSAVWKAVVEGDARRIESAYVADLSAKERERLYAEEARQTERVEDRLKDVPPFLQTLLSSPYVFGEALLALATEVDSEDAINDLIADPPASEEYLLDPWTLLADDQAPLEVGRPDLSGEKRIDDGTFGAPSLLFVLAERIGPKQALIAADGWGGDHYVEFERGDSTCIRIDYRGDRPQDVTEMRDALELWIAAGAAGTASVRDLGPALRFESCDPGQQAGGGNGGSRDALGLAVARTSLATQAIAEGGASESQARCIAAGVIHEFTLAEFKELNTTRTPDQQLIERVQAVSAGCR